jgi:hypothetical protein
MSQSTPSHIRHLRGDFPAILRDANTADGIINKPAKPRPAAKIKEDVS